MELEQLRSLRPALERFVAQFDSCIKTQPSRRHLRTYLNGQLGPLERKSVEPIALQAKVSPRTLQEFLSLHRRGGGPTGPGPAARRTDAAAARRGGQDQLLAENRCPGRPVPCEGQTPATARGGD